MPCLKIHTNLSPQEPRLDEAISALSPKIAEALEKPEDYVQVVILAGLKMTFGGSPNPTAFVELKSIGLPQEKAPMLAELICGELHQILSIPPSRVFIEFTNSTREMFAWDSKIFG